MAAPPRGTPVSPAGPAPGSLLRLVPTLANSHLPFTTPANTHPRCCPGGLGSHPPHTLPGPSVPPGCQCPRVQREHPWLWTGQAGSGREAAPGPALVGPVPGRWQGSPEAPGPPPGPPPGLHACVSPPRPPALGDFQFGPRRTAAPVGRVPGPFPGRSWINRPGPDRPRKGGRRQWGRKPGSGRMEKPGAAQGCPQGGVQGPPRVGPQGRKGSPSPTLSAQATGTGSGVQAPPLDLGILQPPPRDAGCTRGRVSSLSSGVKSPASRVRRLSFILSHQTTRLPSTDRQTETGGTHGDSAGTRDGLGRDRWKPGFLFRDQVLAAARTRLRPVSRCQNQARLAVGLCPGWGGGWRRPQPQSLPWRQTPTEASSALPLSREGSPPGVCWGLPDSRWALHLSPRPRAQPLRLALRHPWFPGSARGKV